MAGNASNWYKPTHGPLKGQAVYVSMARLEQTDQVMAMLTKAVARRTGQPLHAAVLAAIEADNIKAQRAPNKTAQTGGALAPGQQLVTGTPTPRAQEMSVRAAMRAYTTGTDDQMTGDGRLGALYAAQGYNAKPDVLTRSQIDAYVKAGEVEVFRGTTTRDNPDAYSESYRSAPEHYPGYGTYGNGTYTAEDYRMAQGYAGGAGSGIGTVLRMTIKADAKIGDYNQLSNDRRTGLNALRQSPGFQIYERALASLQSQRRAVAADKVISREEKVAQIEAIGKRYDRVIVRRDREYPANGTIYHDVGAYATSLGYDGVRVDRGGAGRDFLVIYNRGATRVQDTSIFP